MKGKSVTGDGNSAPKSEAAAPIIGIRDSGVGGLTVAREVQRALPQARLLYFADTAHVPYGDRAPEEVKFFALSISQFLLERGAQIIVFACNTTSAYALSEARARFSCPVIGMIEPGVRAALEATRNQRIGVLATQATVDSGAFSRTIARFSARAQVCEVACPDFVPLVENEQTRSQEARRAACKYLQALQAAGCDTMILGCTHYPLLLPLLREIAPTMRFIDPARAVAREVSFAVQSQGFCNPASTCERAVPENDIFFVSGDSNGVRHWIADLLDNSAPQLENAPVFERNFSVPS